MTQKKVGLMAETQMNQSNEPTQLVRCRGLPATLVSLPDDYGAGREPVLVGGGDKVPQIKSGRLPSLGSKWSFAGLRLVLG